MTVTKAFLDLLLPFMSETVKTTVWSCDVWVQSNEVLSSDLELIPQLSDELISTWLTVKFAFPVASKYIVSGCVATIGDIVSITLTIDVAVFILPFISVIVNVTVLAPTLMHVKLDISIVSVFIPQLSKEPLLTSAAEMEPTPRLFI